MKLYPFQLVRQTIMGSVSLLLALSAPRSVASIATPLGSWSDGLRAPSDLVAGANGTIFAVESGAGRIVAIDAFGRSSVALEGLNRPLAIAVDGAGNFYVSQQADGSVTVFDPQWQTSGRLGAGAGEFTLPNAIAVDTSDSNTTVYVCDGQANEIKAYRNRTLWLRFGTKGTGDGQFNFPAGVWVSPAGEVFVVDQGNDRAQVFNRSGAFLRSFALGDGTAFTGPSGRSLGITGDRQGRLYVADAFQGFIRVFSTNGTSVDSIGDFGVGAGQFRTPARLTVDSLNRLCVASVNNSRLEILGLSNYLHVTISPPQRIFARGTDITLTAANAGPGNFTYQWRKNGSDIPGATNSVLSLPHVLRLSSGIYSVVADGVTSPDAAITVLAAPQILTPPASQSVFQGGNVVLSVSATGDALAYQWQLNGAELPDATNATLSFADAQPETTGSYAVSVANAVGKVTSDAAVLTVRPPPLAPQIDNFASAPDGGVSFQINGDPGYIYSFEGSTNLLDWFGLFPVTNETGTVDLVLPEDFNQPMLFYRIKWSP